MSPKLHDYQRQCLTSGDRRPMPPLILRGASQEAARTCRALSIAPPGLVTPGYPYGLVQLCLQHLSERQLYQVFRNPDLAPEKW